MFGHRAWVGPRKLVHIGFTATLTIGIMLSSTVPLAHNFNRPELAGEHRKIVVYPEDVMANHGNSGLA